MSEKKTRAAGKAMKKAREITLRPVEIDGLQAMVQGREQIQKRLNDALAEILLDRKIEPAKIRIDIDPSWTKLVLIDEQ